MTWDRRNRICNHQGNAVQKKRIVHRSYLWVCATTELVRVTEFNEKHNLLLLWEVLEMKWT